MNTKEFIKRYRKQASRIPCIPELGRFPYSILERITGEAIGTMKAATHIAQLTLMQLNEIETFASPTIDYKQLKDEAPKCIIIDFEQGFYIVANLKKSFAIHSFYKDDEVFAYNGMEKGRILDEQIEIDESYVASPFYEKGDFIGFYAKFLKHLKKCPFQHV